MSLEDFTQDYIPESTPVPPQFFAGDDRRVYYPDFAQRFPRQRDRRADAPLNELTAPGLDMTDQPPEARVFAPYEVPGYEPVHLNGHVFTEPRQYGVYEMAPYMKKLERVCNALELTGVVPKTALDQTMAFAERAFDVYEGRTELDYPGSHAFIIPTFVSSWQNGEYNSEIQTSFPISQYVDSKTLVDTVAGVPPLVIESYPVDEDGRQAHVLFAPVLPDMFVDLGFAGGMRMSEKVVNDTARFARERVGARVAGLGAMLPAAVGLGEKVKIEGLEATTGHGGTVDLVARTVDRVVSEKGLANNTIGVVGAAGAIAKSSLTVLLRQYPDAKFVANDSRFVDGTGAVSAKSLEKYLENFDVADRSRITIVPTLDEVFDRAKVNVSAISGTVDVASEIKGDMDGVVVVDDSQPGAFSRKDVEAKGGRVVWVVGQDYTEGGQLTRVGDFRYGDNGLYRDKDVFGCEAEAFVVYQSGNPENAVRGRVNPAMQQRIGALFTKYGIGISDTLQSDGYPVVL